MIQGKDQQKGHSASKETTGKVTPSTPGKDSTLCSEHNKDKALCADQHHSKPVTGTDHHKK